MLGDFAQDMAALQTFVSISKPGIELWLNEFSFKFEFCVKLVSEMDSRWEGEASQHADFPA